MSFVSIEKCTINGHFVSFLDEENLPGLVISQTPNGKNSIHDIYTGDKLIYDIYCQVDESYPSKSEYVLGSKRLRDGLKFYDIEKICTCKEVCMCNKRYRIKKISDVTEFNLPGGNLYMLNKNTFYFCNYDSEHDYFSQDLGSLFMQIKNRVFSIKDNKYVNVIHAFIRPISNDMISITDKETCTVWSIKDFDGTLSKKRKVLSLSSTIMGNISSDKHVSKFIIGNTYKPIDHGYTRDYTFVHKDNLLIVHVYGTSDGTSSSNRQPRITKYYELKPFDLSEDDEDKPRCSICFKIIKRKYLLVPCGHATFCQSCAESLNCCPMCRKQKTHAVPVFD
jgi:hypothetical protein